MNYKVTGAGKFNLKPIDRTIRKLARFAFLPKGWNFGEGGPIDRHTISSAARIANFSCGLGFERSNAFPGVSGEILIAFYKDDQCVEVTLETGRPITIVLESPERDDIEFSCRDIDHAEKILHNICREIWQHSSELYIPFILTTTDQSLLTWHLSLRPQREAEVSPYLTEIVPSKRRGVYVAISHDSTQETWGNRRYTGSSNLPNYPMTAHG